MGRDITHTFGRAFQTHGQAFQTLCLDFENIREN